MEIAARNRCGLMLWLVEPAAVRECSDRLRRLGVSVPLAAALPLNPNEGQWLEIVKRFRDAGADLLILVRYGRSRLTEGLERFADEVLTQID